MKKSKNNLWYKILTWLGWKMIIPDHLERKSVICVAPHTSNFDFPLGLLYYHALGRKTSFMMKKEWFFFPISYLLRALGGFPINRSKNSSTVDAIIAAYSEYDDFNMAITPEGTRSGSTRWKSGFYRIALGAGIPIELARIDFKKKEIGIFEVFYPTGDMEADIAEIRSRYSKDMARFPHKFIEHDECK